MKDTVAKNISPNQPWSMRKWLSAVGVFALALAVGLGLGNTEYVYFVTWVHLLVLGELTAAMVLGACLAMGRVVHWRTYLVVSLTLHAFTLGVAVSANTLKNSKEQERYSSFALIPEARETLPALRSILYDGAWAKKAALRFLEGCRKNYPVEAKDIDTYIAAWFA